MVWSPHPPRSQGSLSCRELRAGGGSRLNDRVRLFRSELQTFLLFTKGIRLAQRANSRSLEHTLVFTNRLIAPVSCKSVASRLHETSSVKAYLLETPFQ